MGILTTLAKSKLEKVKKKIQDYLLSNKEEHFKVQGISVEHRYMVYEFYLVFYKTHYDVIKSRPIFQDIMFDMSNKVLDSQDIEAKELKNVVDFCTFILKNTESEQMLDRITECARKMVFDITNEDETIRNSISSFVKMIYFNPISINDIR